MGGDKPSNKLKDFESDEVMAYKQALQDLVKGVAVAHSLGKTSKDF